MAKVHKNQSFRTLDLLGLVILVGGVGSIFGAILAQALQDDRPERARTVAEGLARQIHAQQVSASQPPAILQRGPASVQLTTPPLLTSGELGRDPWGRPFHYRVRKESSVKGNLVRIFVWSDGPNEKPETDAELFESKPLAAQPLRGDDIGFIDEYTEL